MPSKSPSKGIQDRLFTLGVLLQKIDQGQHPKSIASDLNKSKQWVNYYIRRLERLEYIRRKIRSNIAIYELLPKGKDFLVRHDGLRRGVLPRFHHYCHRHRVMGNLGRLDDFLSLSKGASLKGGVIEVDGVFELDNERFSVRRWHSDSGEQLFIYAPATYASNVGDALVSAGIKVDRVARAIQDRFGVQLSEYEKMQRPEFAYERDPYARYWMDISGGANVKTEEGTIDQSEGSPEAEFFTTESAVAYLKMPKAVEKQGSEIREIRETFKGIADDYRKTTDDFGREMRSHLALINTLDTAVKQLSTPWIIRIIRSWLLKKKERG